METTGSPLVYLGAGSNLGKRYARIEEGFAVLELAGAIHSFRMSSFYESEPVGWDGGPWYLNAVAEITTDLDPETLLGLLQQTERQAGRTPGERNSPRPLDLDLLLFGDQVIRLPDLIVPHPRMLERAFVLWPLAEIAPNAQVAPGLTAHKAKECLQEHETIRLWKYSDEPRFSGQRPASGRSSP